MTRAGSNQQTHDEATLNRLSNQLSIALTAAIGPWVQATILAKGASVISDQLRASAAAAAREAEHVLSPKIRQLLELDIDEQWTTPLAIAREAVGPITETLLAFDAPQPKRDADAVRIHPEDVFSVMPATFAEIHPDLQLPGIEWGAAKAHVFLSRRKQAVGGDT